MERFRRWLLVGLSYGLLVAMAVGAERDIRLDGLTVTPIYHGTVWVTLREGDQTWHVAVDPWKQAPLPKDKKAHLILITDVHYDHMDAEAIRSVAAPDVEVVAPPAVVRELKGTLKGMKLHELANGQTWAWRGLQVEAVPMYNTSPDRAQYHTKGRGNGYVLQFQNTRVYIAGDTQCTPEMRALKDIDLALVPINLPYTMDADEAAQCVKAFRPKRVVPYHYQVGQANPDRFVELLRGEKGITVLRVLDGRGGP
ncbi:hypothetical protein HRbin11_00150 [bacterium HR11]|nr:hypothetical protein HRbin11_00150 [bacterium HR11]